MKLPDHEFASLKREVLQYAATRPIGFGTRGMRDYWDAFAAVMDARERVQHKSGWSHYYDDLGLNDNHIQTALKRIAAL